jgi:hypothetical protein
MAWISRDHGEGTRVAAHGAERIPRFLRGQSSKKNQAAKKQQRTRNASPRRKKILKKQQASHAECELHPIKIGENDTKIKEADRPAGQPPMIARGLPQPCESPAPLLIV